MNEYLDHSGIKGQKWGLRRFQNEDGTLTDAGRKRYGIGDSRKSARKALNRISDDISTSMAEYHRAKVDYDPGSARMAKNRYEALTTERSRMEKAAGEKGYSVSYRATNPSRDNRPVATRRTQLGISLIVSPLLGGIAGAAMMSSDIKRYGEIGAGVARGTSRRYNVAMDTPMSQISEDGRIHE